MILVTLALLSVVGFSLRAFLARYRVPPAVSLMALGVLVGPSALAILPDDWLAHRTTLSRAAFVVLLLRAGFGLPRKGLGGIVVFGALFGMLPVAAEFGVIASATRLVVFDSWSMCFLAGFLVAAVSPAVILPAMLDHKDRGRGAARLVPDRIIGQTVVNAFVAQAGILLMLQVTADGGSASIALEALARLPLSLVLGTAIGVTVGFALRIDSLLGKPGGRRVSSVIGTRFFALGMIAAGAAVYFGGVAVNRLEWSWLSFDTVFATLAVGVVLRRRLEWCEPALRRELRRSWMVAEIVLFANLGSQIDLDRLTQGGSLLTLLIVMAVAVAARLLVARAMSVATDLTREEQIYVTVAHVPKATIQAVFGALPLVTFLERGQTALVDDGSTLLVMAVLAIVATAPLGAVLLERSFAPRERAARRRSVSDSRPPPEVVHAPRRSS